jgi:hypothetical protein
MHRTVWSTFVVVLLVLLAGCAGFASDGGSTPTPTATAPSTPTATPTVTPAPTDTSTTTSTAERTKFPSGWSATGVENATLARDTHYRAVLNGPSATVRYRSREVVPENRSNNETTLRLTYDTGTDRLYASLNGTDDHREVFLADGTLSRWSVRNETLLGQSNAQFYRVAQSVDRRVLTSQLLLYKLAHERTVERNGTTAFVYNVTGVYDNTLSNTYGSGESGSGTVVVAASGRLLEVETTVTYTGGTVRYRYAQTRLGETSVATPAWASEA